MGWFNLSLLKKIYDSYSNKILKEFYEVKTQEFILNYNTEKEDKVTSIKAQTFIRIWGYFLLIKVLVDTA